jgi:hypothetical protein
MTKKILIKESNIKNRVHSFVYLHPTWSKSAVVKHFMLENIPRSTIYDILKKKGEQDRSGSESRKRSTSDLI